MADERYIVVDRRDIHPGPFRHDVLPPDFVVRAKLVQYAFGDAVLPDLPEFVDNFRRDADPGRELMIWERMASAFLSMIGATATAEERRAVAGALLEVSMDWPAIRDAPPADPRLRAAVEAFASAGQAPPRRRTPRGGCSG